MANDGKLKLLLIDEKHLVSYNKENLVQSADSTDANFVLLFALMSV